MGTAHSLAWNGAAVDNDPNPGTAVGFKLLAIFYTLSPPMNPVQFPRCCSPSLVWHVNKNHSKYSGEPRAVLSKLWQTPETRRIVEGVRKESTSNMGYLVTLQETYVESCQTLDNCQNNYS